MSNGNPLAREIVADALAYIETNPDAHESRLLAVLLYELDGLRAVAAQYLDTGRGDLDGWLERLS